MLGRCENKTPRSKDRSLKPIVFLINANRIADLEGRAASAHDQRPKGKNSATI
jgi:hypothetical protein